VECVESDFFGRGLDEARSSRLLERFHYVCSGLGAMPTAAVGMSLPQKPRHGHDNRGHGTRYTHRGTALERVRG
jgi:hypothetical protein